MRNRQVLSILDGDITAMAAQEEDNLTFVCGYGKLGVIHNDAPVAQRIERWPPKPEAQVRVLAGVWRGWLLQWHRRAFKSVFTAIELKAQYSVVKVQ